MGGSQPLRFSDFELTGSGTRSAFCDPLMEVFIALLLFTPAESR
jgi:hypothetical protein